LRGCFFYIKTERFYKQPSLRGCAEAISGGARSAEPGLLNHRCRCEATPKQSRVERVARNPDFLTGIFMILIKTRNKYRYYVITLPSALACVLRALHFARDCFAVASQRLPWVCFLGFMTSHSSYEMNLPDTCLRTSHEIASPLPRNDCGRQSPA
jgi:hypothetical protein